MNTITGKEELFCRLFVSCRNPREAAFRAGYRICPEITSIRLMKKEGVKNMISALEKETEISEQEIKAGLRRIAFSSSADAVRLLLSDDTQDVDTDSLDLFNISEIKKSKNGGIEIKFFDRIKALEKLGEITCSSKTGSSQPFYEALEKSAQALNRGECR